MSAARPPDPVALIDQLLRYLDSPITDEQRGQIQEAVRLIREEVIRADAWTWTQAYEGGFDRGQLHVPPPIQLAAAELLEQLAEDLAAGRALTH